MEVILWVKTQSRSLTSVYWMTIWRSLSLCTDRSGNLMTALLISWSWIKWMPCSLQSLDGDTRSCLAQLYSCQSPELQKCSSTQLPLYSLPAAIKIVWWKESVGDWERSTHWLPAYKLMKCDFSLWVLCLSHVCPNQVSWAQETHCISKINQKFYHVRS